MRVKVKATIVMNLRESSILVSALARRGKAAAVSTEEERLAAEEEKRVVDDFIRSNARAGDLVHHER